jgi:hypothetical protein
VGSKIGMPIAAVSTWWTPRRIAVASGAVILAVVMAGLAHDRGWEPDWLEADFVIKSAIAGAFLGNLAWIATDARRRITRLGVVLTGLSLAVWLNFLVFGESYVPEPPVQSNGMGEIEMFHGLPFPVAGRAMGTHYPVNRADTILNLAAGPAVFYAASVSLRASHYRDVDDAGRSYVVAALGGLLSTAFWLAAGNGLAARFARRRALKASLRTPG